MKGFTLKVTLSVAFFLLLCAPSCYSQTIDKAFVFVNGTSILATVADVENTHYALVSNPHIQEGNPLYFSRRPSRARMYEINSLFLAPQLYYSWKWKKEDDEDRRNGVKLAKYRWYVIPVLNTAAHGVGVTLTLSFTGR